MINKRVMYLLPLIVGVMWTGTAQGQPEPATEDHRLFGSVTLEKLTVTGQRLEPEQEIALRLVSWGLNAPRSTRAEDAWMPYCWVDTKRGSHLKYLYCGSNGGLNAVSRSAQALLINMGAGGGRGSKVVQTVTTGEVFRSRRPMNELQLETLIGNLGSPALNREIVKRVMKTGEFPDNLPYQRELNEFADALAEVKRISAEYDPQIKQASADEKAQLLADADARKVAAIEATGLTPERYNEISALVDEYASMKAIVTQKLAAQ